MPAQVDLLVIGDVNPDLVLTGDVVPSFGQAEQILDGAHLTVGGSGAITACGAARLGLTVAICGAVGDDRFGTFMREELEARGVDTRDLRTRPSIPTGITVVLSRPQDRASLTLPGAIATLEPGDVDRERLRAARHVHVSQYFMLDALRPHLPALLQEAAAAGAATSIDPNADPRGGWDRGLRALLPRLDVFLPNAAELRAIAGSETDPTAAARRLGASLVVAKDGEHGSFAVRDGDVVRHAGFAVDAVDATGAGDSFDAGFIAASLEGMALADGLRFANACGALSTRALGGVDAQPTRREVEDLISAHPVG